LHTYVRVRIGHHFILLFVTVHLVPVFPLFVFRIVAVDVIVITKRYVELLFVVGERHVQFELVIPFFL